MNLRSRSCFLKLPGISREAAVARSCGRKPAERDEKYSVSREAATAIGLSGMHCRRFAAQNHFIAFPPWADAHGYMLPSLRDSGNAQLQNLRYGL
jgi:hypothetical protein